jgi:hypothetical protein
VQSLCSDLTEAELQEMAEQLQPVLQLLMDVEGVDKAVEKHHHSLLHSKGGFIK